MGKYDTCMKEFLQNKDRFADLFNGCCFQGRQIIRAEDLREASENYVITDKRLPGKTRQKDTEIIRDVKMVTLIWHGFTGTCCRKPKLH